MCPVHLYAIPRRGGIAFVTNNMLGRLCGTVFQFETRLPAESSLNIPDMFRGIQPSLDYWGDWDAYFGL